MSFKEDVPSLKGRVEFMEEGTLMIYKILHKVFGWDYVYWRNTVDSGIARVHLTHNGVPFYWRYKTIKLADKITYRNQVMWLTCSPYKYL